MNPTLSILLQYLYKFAVLFLVFILVSLVFNYVSKIDPNPNIIVAFIAGIFTVSGYFITRYFERKRIIEQEIRKQKLPVYEEFIAFFYRILKGVKDEKPLSQTELETFIMNFNQKSIIWLSDASLQAYL